MNLTEKQWQAQVLDLAKIHGWRHYHTYDSRRSDPGFPDLVLVRGERLIFAELKGERGLLSPEQDTWLQALDAASDGARAFEVYVWRPRDLPEIVEILGRGR